MMHTPDYYRELQERECKSGPHSLTNDEMSAIRLLEGAAPDMMEALDLVDLLLTAAAQNGPNSKPPVEDLNRMMDAVSSALSKARGEV